MKKYPLHKSILLILSGMLFNIVIAQDGKVSADDSKFFEVILWSYMHTKVPVVDPATVRMPDVLTKLDTISKQYHSFNRDFCSLTLEDAAKWQQVDEYAKKLFPFLDYSSKDFRIVDLDVDLKDKYFKIVYSDGTIGTLNMLPLKSFTELSMLFTLEYPDKEYLDMIVNYYPDGNVKLVYYAYYIEKQICKVLLHRYSKDGTPIGNEETHILLNSEKAYRIAGKVTGPIPLNTPILRFVDTNYGVVWKVIINGEDNYVADNTGIAFEKNNILIFDDDAYKKQYGDKDYKKLEEESGKTILIIRD